MAEEKADQNKKILLLEDSTLQTLPSYARQIFNHILLPPGSENDSKVKLSSSCDILFSSIICLALESGFAQAEIEDLDEKCHIDWEYCFNNQNLKYLAGFRPNLNKNDNVFSIRLKVIGFNNSDCLLIGIISGDIFCVTISPTDGCGRGRSICLSILRFVVNIKNNNWAARLRNLRELSYLLKEKLFTPIRNSFWASADQKFAGLNGIPTEMLHIIALRYLTREDLVSLASTCKVMYQKTAAIFFNRKRKIVQVVVD